MTRPVDRPDWTSHPVQIPQATLIGTFEGQTLGRAIDLTGARAFQSIHVLYRVVTTDATPALSAIGLVWTIAGHAHIHRNWVTWGPEVVPTGGLWFEFHEPVLSDTAAINFDDLSHTGTANLELWGFTDSALPYRWRQAGPDQSGLIVAKRKATISGSGHHKFYIQPYSGTLHYAVNMGGSGGTLHIDGWGGSPGDVRHVLIDFFDVGVSPVVRGTVVPVGMATRFELFNDDTADATYNLTIWNSP